MAPKKIHNNSIIDQRAIALIQGIVGEMGYVFYPTGGVEAGIDGTIEIRDSSTGEVTNCEIKVQSKSTSRNFTAESDDSFTYLCDERDLKYWLGGNVPVILIVSRPDTKEAYWVSINDYFSDPAKRQTRKVFFHKSQDRFDASKRSALAELAIPKDSGLSLHPTPRAETLYSNLLEVKSFSPTIYTATTEITSRADGRDILNSAGSYPGSEWIMTGGQILSFHDLKEYPWNLLCDQGTIEEHDVSEWSKSTDEDVKRHFVQLLNLALTTMTRKDLSYDNDKHYQYFRPTEGLANRSVSYQSLHKSTSREVFRVYLKKRDPTQRAYCRHMAFKHNFNRYNGEWFMEIVPTYHFTSDGYRLFYFFEDTLKGIKKLERNNAVFGQVYFWSRFLSPDPDLFTEPYSFLKFGTLKNFDVQFGIDDNGWLPREDKEEQLAINSDDTDVNESISKQISGQSTLELEL